MKKLLSIIFGLAIIAAAVFYFFFYPRTKDVDLGSDKLDGPLSEYYKVVVNDYELNSGVVNIEFEKTADGFPAPWVEGMEIGYYEGQLEPVFGLEFIGSDGNVVYREETDLEEMDLIGDDTVRKIAALSKGERASIAFTVGDESNMNKVETIKVTSRLEYHAPVTAEPAL